jgi:DNA polymerase III sliding clamp (beta) subunit (PCNA family)
MKINRKSLDTALGFFRLVSKVEGHNGCPLLTIEVGNNAINLNNRTACHVLIADGCEQWMRTVSLDDLSQLVKSSKASQIEMNAMDSMDSADHKCLVVTTEHAARQLPDCDEVIMVEYSEPLTVATIASGALLQALDACEHSIAKEPGRYSINNLFLHCEKNTLNVVSTDGCRMSHYRFHVEQPDFQAYIVRDAVGYVKKQLAASSAVTIKTHANHATGDNVCTIATSSSVTHHTTKGDFPRYAKVIPEDASKLATLPVDTLKGILSSLPKVKKDDFAWLIRLVSSPKGLTVQTTTEGNTKNWQIVKTLPIATAKADACFKASYVADFLNTLQDDSFELWYEASDRPCLMKAGASQYIIMPLSRN